MPSGGQKRIVRRVHGEWFRVNAGCFGCILGGDECDFLIPETLQNKRGSADTIKLRILRWGDHPGLSGWFQCNHKGPCKRETGGTESEREDVRMEAEVRREKVQLCWL